MVMNSNLDQVNNTVIDVKELGKCYRIGTSKKDLTSDNTISAFIRLLKTPLDNYRKYRSLYRFDDIKGNLDDNIVWALKNISFQVKQGDVLGVVGRNGAGKSTLLKILSRITLPTQGRVEIQGRVSSLLEVGTGFHLELTGRENIYLNGTILGMKRREVTEKFDEIVDFSGVEKFIDTPVKRYSSGMKVRLAFSVAAHLEPEILLIDEVLAVGDASFQTKCLGKMEDVAKQGRTVLFVSHNMPAVASLCNRVMHLKSDQIIEYDDPRQGIEDYLQSMNEFAETGNADAMERAKGFHPIIKKIEYLNGDDQIVTSVPAGGRVRIKIHYEHDEPIRQPYFGIIFESQMGVRLFWLQTALQKGLLPDLPASGTVVCNVPRLPIIPGVYYLTVGCGSGKIQLDQVARAGKLTVHEADVFGTGRLPTPAHGMMLVDADWEV
jgi:lipopolysaccharide transport system ATP-binding protein